MKIYTKTGDDGSTSLYSGIRLPKDAIFFDILGENDELSSRTGYLCSLLDNSQHDKFHEHKHLQNEICKMLREIQGNLQDINTIISSNKPVKYVPTFSDSKVLSLEILIDTIDEQNSKLTKFILPGVDQIDGQAHLCRTQARKVERYIYRLHNSSEIVEDLDLSTIQISSSILKYVNRLSDFFFVVARWICKYICGKHDVYK